MDKYILIKGINALERRTKNLYGNLSYIKCMVHYPKELRINVASNIRFKNMHKGERCFILGNGPSIKTQDLSKLKNEIVFTVNQASRNPQIRELSPKYHFWIDPVFFDLDRNKPEDMELLETFKSIYTDDNRPITFLPQQAYDFVKKYELDKAIDVQFMFTKVMLRKEYNSEFNFSKVIPCFGTVVQTCVAMAFYMGFKEIYLLGCDSTGIITMINGAMDYNDAQYSYDISENERKRMHDKYGNPEFLKLSISGFVSLIDTYDKLYKYAFSHGIKLVNCSAKTILTSLPRQKFEEVIAAN